MLHALSPKLVVCKVQIHQCPDGGNAISTKVGSGLAWHLLVLPDGISESSHTRGIISPSPELVEAAERVVADIQRRQRPDGGYGRCTAVWTVHVFGKRI